MTDKHIDAPDELDEILYQYRKNISEYAAKAVGMPKSYGDALYQQVKDAQAKAKAALDAYTATKVLEGREEEAKYWERNIIPAVRSVQVELDVNKRLAQLASLKEQAADEGVV